jgi:poly(hydroxyalkanoate) granule-associated protein
MQVTDQYISRRATMAVRKKGKSKRASARTATPMANAIEVGHHIWLAGLGALARAQREGPKLFESLVEEGGSVQERQRTNAQRLVKGAWEGLRETVDARTAEVRGKAGETMENLEALFQSRVQKALQQLGMPTSKEINALSRKVNELNQSVHALTRSRSGGRTSKMAASPARPSDETAVV